MEDQVVVCPKCGARILLSQAMSAQVRDELEQKLAAARAQIEADVKRQAEAAGRVQLTDLQNRIQEQDAALKKAQAAEIDVLKLRRELDTRRQELDAEVERKLIAGRGQIEAEAVRKAGVDQAAKLQDVVNQLAEKDAALCKARNLELELRGQQRKLEESRKDLELEVARKLDAERKNVEAQVLARAEEKHRLDVAGLEQQIAGFKVKTEELQRKLTQGSQQAQGEVLELELEEVLRSRFPHDLIEPVPKGRSGADVLQRVNDVAGRSCGTIAWEAKRTKAWNDEWIDKLKDDQRAAKADLAIILSTTLPREITTFECRDGVWVTSYECALGLGSALRAGLIQTAVARQAAAGQSSKMEVLYHYLSGPEFRQRVEAIVEATAALRTEIDREKRAMIKSWAAREKQIERVIVGAAGMYGDMQGIMGASLPQIENLELKAIEVEDDGAAQ